MKKTLSLVVIFIAVLTGCEKKNSSLVVPAIEVDCGGVTNANDSSFESINYIPISLPDSIIVGEINHIKTFGDYYFLHDEMQTKSLTIVNRQGEFITQLRNSGQGPGEISALSAFTFDEKNNRLYVYDREKLQILMFSFPDLSYRGYIDIGKYLMNIEFTGENNLVLVSENVITKSKYEGLMTLDLNTEKIESLAIENKAGSIEMSYPNTFSTQANKLFYAFPDEYTTIYKLNTRIEPLYRIHFGKNNLPPSVFEQSDFEAFERVMSEDPPKATWVQNIWFSENKMMFSYLFGTVDIRFNAVYHFDSQKLSNYYNLYIPYTEGVIPNSLGVSDRGQLSIIYADIVDETMIKDNSEFFQAYQESAKSAFGMILVEYILD